MKKTLIVSAIVAAMLTTAAAAAEAPVYTNSTDTQGKSNEIVIMVSNGAAESSPGVQAQLTTLAPEIETATDGKVGVEIYSAGQLGDDVTATEMVVAGQLDANNTSTAPLVNYVPELGIFDIPFLFADEAEADYILDNTEVGTFLNGKLEENGIINVAWNENGFRELTNSKRAVATVDDVAGLKIRTQSNEVHQAIFSALGASPTVISFSELYTAMEQGTVDAQENPYVNIANNAYYEVQKNLVETNHVFQLAALLISESKYQSLTDEEKAWVAEAAQAAADAEWAATISDNETAKQKAIDAGMTFVTLDHDELFAATQSVYDQYRDQYSNLLSLMGK